MPACHHTAPAWPGGGMRSPHPIGCKRLANRRTAGRASATCAAHQAAGDQPNFRQPPSCSEKYPHKQSPPPDALCELHHMLRLDGFARQVTDHAAGVAAVPGMAATGCRRGRAHGWQHQILQVMLAAVRCRERGCLGRTAANVWVAGPPAAVCLIGGRGTPPSASLAGRTPCRRTSRALCPPLRRLW